VESMSVDTKKDNKEKSVDEWLNPQFDKNCKSPAHSFTTRLVLVDDDDEDFSSSFDESYSVYKKYQMCVHGDPESKCSENQFKRFLCKSPLVSKGGMGSYHQQYLVDGCIIAVGVIDVLPSCISSVYLYYDPDFRFLSLGTLTSLLEVGMVRDCSSGSRGEQLTSVTQYYLGFYVHTCQKMRYKGRYSPSYLLCPETYLWCPLEQCLPILDSKPYSKLHTNSSVSTAPSKLDISKTGVLYGRRAVTYELYRELFAADLSDSDTESEVTDSVLLPQDEEEVLEYVGLVTQTVANRMLLFRSGQ